MMVPWLKDALELVAIPLAGFVMKYLRDLSKSLEDLRVTVAGISATVNCLKASVTGKAGD